MARGALVAALGLELDDPDLLAALVPDDLRLDLDLAEVTGAEDGVVLLVAGEEQRLERDGRALVLAHAIDDERVALLHAVLLTADFHDCVHDREKRPPLGRAPDGQFSGPRPQRPARRVRVGGGCRRQAFPAAEQAFIRTSRAAAAANAALAAYEPKPVCDVGVSGIALANVDRGGMA